MLGNRQLYGKTKEPLHISWSTRKLSQETLRLKEYEDYYTFLFSKLNIKITTIQTLTPQLR